VSTEFSNADERLSDPKISDIGGNASTSEIGDAVAKELGNLLKQ
jgi:hypothetical protein